MTLRDCHWSLYFLFWLVFIVGGACVLGAIVFAAIGAFLDGHHWSSDLRLGAFHVGFFALIWAPGISLVLSVIRAYQHRNTAK